VVRFMSWKLPAFIAGLILMATAGVAMAQDAAPGRYTMHKVDGGFVRLDTKTGAVSFCQNDETSWSCAPIDRAAPDTDVEALRKENKELKAEVKRLDELLGLRGERKARGPTFKLPTEQEVDQALNYFERMLKKFQDRLNRLEKKSEPEPSERQL